MISFISTPQGGESGVDPVPGDILCPHDMRRRGRERDMSREMIVE